MGEQKGTSHKFWIAVLAIFAGLATIQIIFLTIQNRELKKALGVSSSVEPPDSLKPGDQVPGFIATNAFGTQTKVSYAEADYLVFITSTKCPWCEKTLPSWKEISDKAKGRPIRIVSIAIDGNPDIKAYVKDNGLNFEVVSFPDPSLQSSYKAFSTPQTLLVKRGGKVEKMWPGMLSDTSKNEILKLLSQTYSVFREPSRELLEAKVPQFAINTLPTRMQGGIRARLDWAS
jgi:peroxiredoxin